MLTKLDFTFNTKAMVEDDDVLVITGYASTVDKDRAGDVVLASAWASSKALDNFKKNPIVLAYHDHSKPIGKVTNISVTDKGLEITAEIYSVDKEVFVLVKNGVLKTFSIGFSIEDATYLPDTDTFYIKEVELHEVSVVSVPCNQDCLFSVAKSLENTEDLIKLKTKFTTKGKTQMDPIELEALMAKVAAKTASDIEAKAIELAATKAAKEAEEANISKVAMEAAKSLIADIEAKAKAEAEAHGDQVKSLMSSIKAFEDRIQGQEEEIKQVLAARTNRLVGAPSATAMSKDLENAVLLGMITQKGTFGTKFGLTVKASALPAGVNTSGSAEVSSSAYEAEFRANLERDIQDRLVFRGLFNSIPMNTANMILPIAANATKASWVGAATFGTAATAGSEIAQTITEINLRTYKLAGYSLLPDELEEDTILPMLPLIRAYLVEAMAYAIDDAILLSTGAGAYANTFKGLLTLASEGTAKVSTTTASSTVKVSAAMIGSARRKLGKRGRNARDIVAVVSQDAYFDLLEDPEFQDVNLVGTSATKLTGEVGSVHGIRIVVADTFADAGNSVAWGVLLDSTNFLVPEQRGLKVELERDATAQTWKLVATQRLGFNQIIAGEGVVSMTYAATY